MTCSGMWVVLFRGIVWSVGGIVADVFVKCQCGCQDFVYLQVVAQWIGDNPRDYWGRKVYSSVPRVQGNAEFLFIHLRLMRIND